MKLIFSILFIFIFSESFSQNSISGIVTDKAGNPIEGANVYLKNSYDGSNTDEAGAFSFTSNLNGIQILLISFIAFEPLEMKADISKKTQSDFANPQSSTW